MSLKSILGSYDWPNVNPFGHCTSLAPLSITFRAFPSSETRSIFGVFPQSEKYKQRYSFRGSITIARGSSRLVEMRVWGKLLDERKLATAILQMHRANNLN